jgi:hypothetical protein
MHMLVLQNKKSNAHMRMILASPCNYRCSRSRPCDSGVCIAAEGTSECACRLETGAVHIGLLADIDLEGYMVCWLVDISGGC